jgi:adenylate kinase family enzyme
MVVKVFILGRPGSGKSAAARHIAALAQNYGWVSTRVNDYEILQAMFRAEKLYQFVTKLRRFRAIKHGGFDIIDPTVLDETLVEVEKRVRDLTLSLEREGFIIIEFARGDYRAALAQIGQDVLQNAYFLFINSDMTSCIRRIDKRIDHPATADDHFVSAEAIKRYYYEDNRAFMSSQFAVEYNILHEKVQVIDNAGTLRSFHKQVYEFAEAILERETFFLKETDPLQDLPFSMPETTDSSLSTEIEAPDKDNI